MVETLNNNDGVVSPEAHLSDAEKQALERVRGTTNPDTVADEALDKLDTEAFKMPDKFVGKTAEDIAKAYVELEKMKAKQENTDKDPSEAPEATNDNKETNDTPEDSSSADEPSSVLSDLSKYHEEFAKEGKLSDASYSELEKGGLSRTDVDNYIEGQQARQKLYASSVYEAAGGEQAYLELVEWGKEHLSDVGKQDFDTKIRSGNIDMAKLAVETALAQRGTPARRVSGAAVSDNGGTKAFADKGEWQKAVRDPLYGKNKKYTQSVDARYIASKRAGRL